MFNLLINFSLLFSNYTFSTWETLYLVFEYLVRFGPIFILGTFVGSFLNVVSDRLQSGESIALGRSHCDKCQRILGALDLVPILSFAFNKGKCRTCKHKLSYYYPISEILTGIMFILAAILSGIFNEPAFTLQKIFSFVYLCLVFSAYVIIFLSDLKYRIIPDRVVFPTLLIVLLFLLSNLVIYIYSSYTYLKNDDFGVYLLQTGFWTDQVLTRVTSLLVTLGTGFLIALFFFLLIVITKGKGMGGGDMKLSLLIGILHPFPFNIISIFMGFLTGATISVLLVLLSKKSIKDTIPFGPFMLLGSMLVLFFGQDFLTWYLEFSKLI